MQKSDWVSFLLKKEEEEKSTQAASASFLTLIIQVFSAI